jgi:CTP synthase (UTP-ammonia lyase)
MNQPLKVGIIGDLDRTSRFRTTCNEALQHAASILSVSVNSTWLPTPSLTDRSGIATLKQFDALWCGPGSPYKSMDGALEGVRFAREMGWPFIGT